MRANAAPRRRTEMNVRWGTLGAKREFFDCWRKDSVASMTLVDVLPQGKLYYYESKYSCDVWVVVGAHSVIVDYVWLTNPAQMRWKVEIWDRALKNDVKWDIGDCREPVYAAKEDPHTKTIIVQWFSPGDWCGLTWHLPLQRESHQL